MNNKILLLGLLLVLSACASSSSSIKDALVKNKETFNYTDKNGSFKVSMESSLGKKGKTYVTKRSMELLGNQKEKILEKSIVLADLGTVKKLPILRPRKSQYSVWFDGKKYFSELNIVPSKKAIDVRMVSPEKQWSGNKLIPFPNTKAIPCFFSQIIECADLTGFINASSKKEEGSMGLLVVWEGYPYLNETFSDFPNDLFSDAELIYDGKTKDAERKFNLKVAGQSIVFVINDKNKMTKMFWVTQGISMVGKSVEKTVPENEEPGFE
jgi:hypothetical protein